MAADCVFKGATRPAILFGVPIVPLIVVEGSLLLIALWLFVLVNGFAALLMAFLGLLSFGWMRLQTKEDDQRLRQIGLRLRLRRPGWLGGMEGYWGGTSSSPVARRRR